jgi:Bacterial Ig-like domain (group 2)
MRHMARRFGMLALAAFAVACGESGVTAATDRAPRVTTPRMTVGPTASVLVTCPTKLEVGSTAPCVAYGYDSNGKFTSAAATNWGSSNTSVATVSSTGTLTAVGAGIVNIVATVGGLVGSLATQLTVVAPSGGGGTLSVSISGRSLIQPNVYCEYLGTASGGTGSYTYAWTQTTGTGVGSATNDYLAKSSSPFTLTLHVTDSNGATGTATKSVSVGSTTTCNV